jgi:GntR family transcriptional regulator
MNLFVSHTTGEPIYGQIKEQIKNQILSGQLKEGELLPSTNQRDHNKTGIR